MHPQREHVLEWAVHLLDLVVDDGAMLSVEGTTPVVALALAVVAGFSQLFSP